MTPANEISIENVRRPILPFIAAAVALAGLADAVYLTVHYLTSEPVPCSITNGCEQVLTSAYAVIGGIPLAAFGAVAYFTAFALALLAAFGDRRMWTLFGVVATLMGLFSVWLVYLQWMVIGAFCQFCLVSAATSLTLFLIALYSRFWKRG